MKSQHDVPQVRQGEAVAILLAHLDVMASACPSLKEHDCRGATLNRHVRNAVDRASAARRDGDDVRRVGKHRLAVVHRLHVPRAGFGWPLAMLEHQPQQRRANRMPAKQEARRALLAQVDRQPEAQQSDALHTPLG